VLQGAAIAPAAGRRPTAAGFDPARPHAARDSGAPMDPTVLAWALAQPAGSRAQTLAAAFTNGTTRVTFDGRTVEYRSLDEIGRALAALHGAEVQSARRPNVTFASFARGSGGA
jgi:hypothetical protein